MKKSLVKIISILVVITFIIGQISPAFAFQNLQASLLSDGNINPERSDGGKNDIAHGLEPGAIGNGQPLLDLIRGQLPEKIELSNATPTIDTVRKVREAIDLAIELYIEKRNKVPAQHLGRAEQALTNLIALQNNLTQQLHLHNAVVTSPEDYLLGFNFQETVGLDIDLVNRLYAISPKRLAQYVYHECIPEKNMTRREDHKTIYREIQAPIFGEDEVIALGQNLGLFLSEKCGEQNEVEMIDYFDEKGNVLGTVSKKEAHSKGLRHKHLQCFVINSKGQLLMQKRSKNEDNPQLWDKSIGGHVQSGEPLNRCLVREFVEELHDNIPPQKPIHPHFIEEAPFVSRKLKQDKSGYKKGEDIIISVYTVQYDGKIKKGEEVEEVKWVTREELEKWMRENPEDFTNDFKALYAMYADQIFPTVILGVPGAQKEAVGLASKKDTESASEEDLSLLKAEIIRGAEIALGHKYDTFEKAYHELDLILHDNEDSWWPTAVQAVEKLKSVLGKIAAHSQASYELKKKALIFLTFVSRYNRNITETLEKHMPDLEQFITNSQIPDDLREVAIAALASAVSRDSQPAIQVLEKLLPQLEKLAVGPQAPMCVKEDIMLAVLKASLNDSQPAKQALERLIPVLKSVVDKSFFKEDYIKILAEAADRGNQTAIKTIDKLTSILKRIIVNGYYADLSLSALINASFQESHTIIQTIESLIVHAQIPIELKRRILKRLMQRIEKDPEKAIKTIEKLMPSLEKLITDQQTSDDLKKEAILALIDIASKNSQLATNTLEKLIPVLENLIAEPKSSSEPKSCAFHAICFLSSKGNRPATQSLERVTAALEKILADSQTSDEARRDAILIIIKGLSGYSEAVDQVLEIFAPRLKNFISNLHDFDDLKKEVALALMKASSEGSQLANNLLEKLLPSLEKIISAPQASDDLKATVIRLLADPSAENAQPVVRVVENLIPLLGRMIGNDEPSEKLRMSAAQSLIELICYDNNLSAIQMLSDLIATNKIHKEIRGPIMGYLNQFMLKGSQGAYLVFKTAFLRRGNKRVLPSEGKSKEVIPVILDVNPSHAKSVSSVFKSGMGKQSDIEIIFDSEDDSGELERFLKKHKGKTIIVNISLGDYTPFRKHYDKVNGILDADLVEKWGKEGVVFVLSAGNEACLSEYSHTVFDNVLIIGSAEKIGDHYEKAADSVFGLDMFCTTRGIQGYERGTSFAAPQIAGLLVRVLRENPELSIPDAIEKIRSFAKPMENSSLFKMGFLGAGVIIPEEISDEDITRPLDKTVQLNSEKTQKRDIKAIIFDMDGTLCEAKALTPYYDDCLVSVIQRKRPDVTREEIISRRKELRSWTTVIKEYGLNLEEYDAELASIPVSELIKPNSELRALLEKLAQKYKIAVLTNNVMGITEKILEALGVRDLFEVIVSCEKADAVKPDPKMFTLTCRELGISPEETVSVGDKYEKDIEPALSLGMGVVMVDNPRQMIRDLESLFPERLMLSSEIENLLASRWAGEVLYFDNKGKEIKSPRDLKTSIALMTLIAEEMNLPEEEIRWLNDATVLHELLDRMDSVRRETIRGNPEERFDWDTIDLGSVENFCRENSLTVPFKMKVFVAYRNNYRAYKEDLENGKILAQVPEGEEFSRKDQAQMEEYIHIACTSDNFETANDMTKKRLLDRKPESFRDTFYKWERDKYTKKRVINGKPELSSSYDSALRVLIKLIVERNNQLLDLVRKLRTVSTNRHIKKDILPQKGEITAEDEEFINEVKVDPEKIIRKIVGTNVPQIDQKPITKDTVIQPNLEKLQVCVRNITLNKIRRKLLDVRYGEKIEVVEEKEGGDSATIADIKIGELLRKELPGLLPGSIVLEEEAFSPEYLKEAKKARFVWVVDPIDGTAAYKEKGNSEYCVGICLLDNGKPVLSTVYSPEYKLGHHNGCLFEARADLEGAYLNGEPIHMDQSPKLEEGACVNHIHTGEEPDKYERSIAELFGKSETIRAYVGHSTLMHYCLAASGLLEGPQAFTRRSPNLWDVIQSAYIVEKAGGVVMLQGGQGISPVDLDKLKVKQADDGGYKLLTPFNVACAASSRDKILGMLNLPTDDIKYRYEHFKNNLMRLLSQNPEETFVLAIDGDIGEEQHAQIMTLWKLVDQIRMMNDADGKPLFPNLRIIRREGAKGDLMREIKELQEEKKVKAENIMMVVQEANLEKGIFDSLKESAWITAIDDSKATNTDNGDYLPVLEAATLTIMAALNADAESIKIFYDKISDKPIDLTKLEEMLKMRIIRILPRMNPVNFDELKETYERVRKIYLAA